MNQTGKWADWQAVPRTPLEFVVTDLRRDKSTLCINFNKKNNNNKNNKVGRVKTTAPSSAARFSHCHKCRGRMVLGLIDCVAGFFS